MTPLRSHPPIASTPGTSAQPAAVLATCPNTQSTVDVPYSRGDGQVWICTKCHDVHRIHIDKATGKRTLSCL